MRQYFILTILLVASSTYGQRLFDSSKVEKVLLSLPKHPNETIADTNIIRAIEAVDKNYRIIADTLYSYKSLRYTVFQTVLIETNDRVFINPLAFGERIKTHNIVFNNKYINIKLDSIAKRLNKGERRKLYLYIANNFDNFSEVNKEVNPQPVRLKYIKFPDNRMVHVGIDIYGKHFLWTIDRDVNWAIVKVYELWVY